MLRQAFEVITANIRTVSLRSYQPSIPQMLIADIEKMLATVPLYQQIQSALVDEEGDRLVQDARFGIYNGLDIIVALTELNLREVEKTKNTMAVLLTCMGNTTESRISEKRTGLKADKLSTCVLLETGAVAASYLDASGKNCSYAWFHPSRPHNGFWGYPRSEKEILDCFVQAARSARLTIDRDCRTLASIPSLVLLAADAYNRSRVIN